MGSFVVLSRRYILGIQEVSRKSWGALGYLNGVQRIPKGSKRGLWGYKAAKKDLRCAMGFKQVQLKENLYRSPLFMSQKRSWVSRELSCYGLDSYNLLQFFKTNLYVSKEIITFSFWDWGSCSFCDINKRPRYKFPLVQRHLRGAKRFEAGPRMIKVLREP